MHFRPEIGESLTLKFAEAAARRREQGLPVISLGLGEPDISTPQVIIQAVKDVLDEGPSTYSSPMGIWPLREMVANELRTVNAIPAQPSSILIAAGAKQAFQIILMAMLEPGDEVIVLEPSFVSFIPQIYLAEPDCIVHTVDVDRESFELSLDAIADKMSEKTKAIVINSPNNPAGYVLSKTQLKAIYDMACEHDAFIISDEVYEKLVFSGISHVSIGSFEDVVDRVVTINGYSKSHAMTGWRLGYACLPAKLGSKVAKIQQHMNTNTCTFIQKAIVKAGVIDFNYLHDYVDKLQSRADTVEQVINQLDGVTFRKPTSGFFAFINISELNLSSNEFCGRLIEEVGVATTPGIAFGKNWDDHVRLSYATSEDTLNEGLRQMSEFVERLGS